MRDLSLLSIFLVGLLGGTHCVGMCGGIVTALSFQLPGTRGRQMGLHLGYNIGRVVSYGIGGAIAGAVGASALLLKGFLPVQEAMYALANTMLIVLGLYLAGIWHGVVYVERVGGFLWKRIQPYLAKLLPATTPARAFAVGLAWGWLPCGLVYSALVTALASGSALHGAVLMLAFGAGTLPNLLAMGLFAQQLKRLMQNRATRLVAGLLVAGFGVLGLVRLATF